MTTEGMPSGLQRACQASVRHSSHKSIETELVRQLKARIRIGGPITVADYMKEVLTNPTAGYYMHKDVFGAKGDFITSPEISQMFGELIGIWCVNEWMQCGSPPALRVVELGPGRGTLVDDMLRVFSQFPDIKDAVSTHLVEVSPKLSQLQKEKLSGQNDEMPASGKHHKISISDKTAMSESGDSDTFSLGSSCYQTCNSKYGSPIYWHKHLRDVPRGFSFYVAHEFFDALPIHKFQLSDGVWREVLVDVDDTSSGPHHLRLVLSPAPTVASKVLLQVDKSELRDHIELCPEAGVITQELANRVQEDGGFALIADYGHSGEKTDTFRAFKEHKLFDVLCEPGTADLTADVDFAYLKKMTNNTVTTHGPISQEMFLQNMGIGVRLQVLLGKADVQQRKSLITGYDMLTNPDKMGERFKFFALMRSGEDKYVPAGFKRLA